MPSLFRLRPLFLFLLVPPPFAISFPTFASSPRSPNSNVVLAGDMTSKEYYRTDGVRIDFDPYALGMAEKYGLPGSTDADGFDPYSDTGKSTMSY